MEKHLGFSIKAETANLFKCLACKKCKINKAPFNKDQHSAARVFDCLHLDLMGPLNPTSKGGMRFALTIVDNLSGYLSAFPLPSKDAAAETIKFVIENEAKRQQRYPIEVVSDGGGEFVNETLKEFFRSKSINHLISEPYHSQHNGKAERANRTIMESLQAVFSLAKIPKNCWHVFIQSCCLALNQIPQNSGGPTPWELLHKSKLPTNYLKPIGSGVIYLLNCNNIKSKLNEKG